MAPPLNKSVLKIDGHRTAAVRPPYGHRTATELPPTTTAAIALRQRRKNAFTTLANDSLMIGAKAPRARMFQAEETNSTQLLQHRPYLNDARSAASNDSLGQDHNKVTRTQSTTTHRERGAHRSAIATTQQNQIGNQAWMTSYFCELMFMSDW